MSDFPEITTEQIVARLRMIVAEPDSLCKTDIHYIEDAADELESKGDEIARLTAERDEARRELCQLKSRLGADYYVPSLNPEGYAKVRGWDCFEEEGK
jgi:hypothetical protein